MSSHKIENNLEKIIANLNKDEFIYEFLIAYDISKSVVTRLKKGDQNRSKREDEVLYAKKIIFRIEDENNLLNAIDDIAQDAGVLKHSPRFAIMTDFKRLVAKDLKLGKTLDIELKELPKHYDFFLPLAGSEVYHSANDNEADRNAAYKMATLYDHLIEENPDIYQSKEQIHHLNVFLSRLLFCFFAEDTGIFPEDSIFTNTLVQHTDDSGKDTHVFLDKLFARLDSQDTTGLPEFLAKFPYVNGGLFQDKISSPKFSAKVRKILVELGELQWKNINPDIFGSMIQAVTTGVDRSKLGQHYTSVPNILKLIKPLFLDEFYEELEKANTINQLFKLQNRIANTKFFDPACGSGNFLIITYKELRVLEIEIIKKIIELSNDAMPNAFASQINISQFYGIEIDDFAHEVAILSLWLAEHQMNIIFEERLFEYAEVASILPLKSMGNIKQGNATQEKWELICPISTTDEVFVIGNPPYLGARYQKDEHREQIKNVLFDYENYKRLDYIVCWFDKASNYIQGKNAKFAFVSTNSITQGEQVKPIWTKILGKNLEIDFAYKSFKWTNNAKGNAGVTVVIIGIRNSSNSPKYLFDKNIKSTVRNIDGYLSDDRYLNVTSRTKPLSNFQPITRTNPALDDGHFLLNETEKYDLIRLYPKAEKIIRPVVGAHEFLQGKKKFCLWISDDNLDLALSVPQIKERIEKVRLYRLNRENRPIKNDPATFPHRFLKMKMAKESVLLLPTVSSERRDYIPCGFFDNQTVVIDPNFAIYEPTPLSFAILSSRMHMVWVKKFSGKLKTDFRYSSTLCYNTFPFPKIDKKQEELLAQYVFDILDARANHIGKTLAWMYNSQTMPSDLKKAHQALDEAIEKCYRLQPFNSDSERLEHLYKLYEKMISEEETKSKK
ncbi:SAM-dependent methyltransferase [Moraxella catarrhalis]|uniref:class I SAM-dependent DNA methyltransferase n=1 Tax=Moraxella catarrhalis TaxID=480 RepID=UPI00128B6D6A|nr:DNA methyltransferase [Moraxella catarrhalis]MPX19309.1 SAM-dependent methyltransferase [Moraxella catarrhalis]